MASSSSPPQQVSSQPSDHLTIHLLIIDPRIEAAFHKAATQGSPSPIWDHFTIHVHACSLSLLEPSHRFDAIVSPANSYGRLDGGFDDAISRALSPQGDYLAVTRRAQQKLRRDCRGYLPPGGCCVVDLPREWEPRGGEEEVKKEVEKEEENGAGEEEQEEYGVTGEEEEKVAKKRSRNVWGCRHVLLCPTMGTPSDIRWDREVIYESTWTMLAAIWAHNRVVDEHYEAGLPPKRRDKKEEKKKIRTILMTPGGTGCGNLSGERWAAQMMLALKHWVLEGEKGEDESTEWDDTDVRTQELMETWEL